MIIARNFWVSEPDNKGTFLWRRPDNAVVKYDWSVACLTAKPWLKNHRGWMAFGPGKDDNNYLKWRNKRGFGIPRKFKTPENAMKALEKVYPFRIKK